MFIKTIGEAENFTLYPHTVIGTDPETAETELIRRDNETHFFYGSTVFGIPSSVRKTVLTQEMIEAKPAPEGREVINGHWLPLESGGCVGKCIHFGVFNSNRGKYYLNGVPTASGSNHVHLWESDDLNTWRWANGGAPVLVPRPGWQVWNLSICPVGDWWYGLCEAVPPTGGPVSLYITRCPDPYRSGVANFEPEWVEIPAIVRGGNPRLRLSSCGKYFVAWHGVRHDERFGNKLPGDWYLTVSIALVADALLPGAWRTLKDSFAIGQTGYDICDPAVVARPGDTLMVVSSGQTRVRMLQSREPLGAIERRLIGSA